MFDAGVNPGLIVVIVILFILCIVFCTTTVIMTFVLLKYKYHGKITSNGQADGAKLNTKVRGYTWNIIKPHF